MAGSFPLPDTFRQRVVVYLTPWCPYCRMARRLLDGKGVDYVTYDVSGNDEARAWLREQSGQHTVPQIFIRGQSIDGFSELSALERMGRLDSLLA